MRLIVCVLLLSFALLFGQSDRSTIRGTVTDQSGAVVPKAELTVTEISTNTLARTVSSDENGNFEVADLKPGTYRLKADAAGFKGFVAENLLLEGAQIRRVDVVLQVGSTTESVTVEAGVAAITTESGMLSGTLTSQNFKDSAHVNPYPSVYAMLTTVPGIQGSGWSVRVSRPAHASGIQSIRRRRERSLRRQYEQHQLLRGSAGLDREQYRRQRTYLQLQHDLKAWRQSVPCDGILQALQLRSECAQLLRSQKDSVHSTRVAGRGQRPHLEGQDLLLCVLVCAPDASRHLQERDSTLDAYAAR
jgi:hypothetical protein